MLRLFGTVLVLAALALCIISTSTNLSEETKTLMLQVENVLLWLSVFIISIIDRYRK